jgi:N-acyl-phosphatidylethanolamine-hydrolysing phospholipase D
MARPLSGLLASLLTGLLWTASAAAEATAPSDVAPPAGEPVRKPGWFTGARRDGSGRFLNLAGPLPTASPLTTFPFFLRRAAAMIAGRTGLPPILVNDGAFLRENAGHSVPTVTWIGHATLLVQMDHVTFLTDPIWSERASPVDFAGPERLQPPGVALDALPPIDFVLVSHNHYDHLDEETLGELARRNPQTRFIVPLENAHTLRDAGVRNVVELDWGQSVRVAGVEIVCLPTQHWSARGPFDGRVALWSSYAVVGPEHRFYFAGDTGYFDGFARVGAHLGPFDLAAVPIGAYLPVEMMQHHHMNPEEAVRAGLDLRARNLVPMHYGTFDLSDEPPDEPPRRFRAAADAAQYQPDQIYVLGIGETRQF